MSEVLNLWYTEFTLRTLGVQFTLLKLLEHGTQVTFVLCFITRVHKDVIQVHQYTSVKQVIERTIHQPLKGRGGITQPEW